VGQVSDELRSTDAQVVPEMRQLQSWGAELPARASIRLDIPPSGFQLWAAYFLAAHPLDTPAQLVGTTYPLVAFGLKADYSVTLAPSVAMHFPNWHIGDPPPYAVGRALRHDAYFSLWRLGPIPGPTTASLQRTGTSHRP
jgi:hypothetical protein